MKERKQNRTLSDLMGDLGEAAQTDLMYENKKRELPSSGMGTATKITLSYLRPQTIVTNST